MNPFDRYFRTLRLLLPRDQRDDIIRELSEEIHSQAADKQAALGRPLEPAEQADLLRQLGHPLLAAARYRPQRHLIGPVLFPYYWLLVKVVLTLVVVTQLIGLTLLLAKGGSTLQLSALAEATVSNALTALGWMTVLAVAADYWLTRSRALERWTPRMTVSRPGRLATTVDRALEAVPGAATRAVRSETVLSKREPTISGFILSIAVSVWWLVGLRYPTMMFGSGASDVVWGPAMNRLYPVLVVAQLLTLTHHFLRLKRPADVASHRASSVLDLVTGIAFIYVVVWSDRQWLVWKDVAGARNTMVELFGRTFTLPEFVNYTFSAIFIAVAASLVIRTLLALAHRVSGGRHSTAHA